MEHNKAPGPDGFPVEFYQKCWEIIKQDLIKMFHDLHKGDIPLFSLSFGVITLLPKVHDANKIQQYRLICLLNVSFKIFTKVADKRRCTITGQVPRRKLKERASWKTDRSSDFVHAVAFGDASQEHH